MLPIPEELWHAAQKRHRVRLDWRLGRSLLVSDGDHRAEGCDEKGETKNCEAEASHFQDSPGCACRPEWGAKVDAVQRHATRLSEICLWAFLAVLLPLLVSLFVLLTTRMMEIGVLTRDSSLLTIGLYIRLLVIF